MSLKSRGVIEIPGAAGSAFDHGIFDTKSRRVFIAHTARNTIEVIDPDAGRHDRDAAGISGCCRRGGRRWRNPGHQSRIGKHRLAGRRDARDQSPCSRPAHGRTALPSSNASRLGSPPASATNSETPTLQAFRLNDGQCSEARPARPAALVRDRCRGGAAIPLHPRAFDDSGRRPAGPAPDCAMAASFGRRAWPRHRPRARTSLRRLRRRRSGRGRQQHLARSPMSGRSPARRM